MYIPAKSSIPVILGTFEGFEEEGSSSYGDSVFLYLVNNRHTHTGIIIMTEIITTIIMIIVNITTDGILLEVF